VLGRRPFLTSGARDLLALAIAISGFVLIGPVQLFMPQPAADYFGGWIWIPLILLYFFCAVLASMLARPRLVVYNITPEHLRPLLENVVSGLDPHRRWAGSTLASPGLGLQLNIECLPGMRNVQLVAVGSEQDLNGWRQLELALKKALKEMPVPANPRGISLVFLGVLMLGLIAYWMARQPLAVARSLEELLHL
jgi:hypothetical protein